MATEDLTTFTEVNGTISKTADRVTLTNFLRNSNSKLYKDYGVDYFTDFVHEYQYRVTSNDIYAWWIHWAVANNVGDVGNMSGRSYLIRSGTGGNAGLTYVYLYEYNNGSNQQVSSSTATSLNTTYYVRVTKSGTSLKAEWFTDAARTNLLITLGPLTVVDTDMRYLYATQSLNSGSARAVNGWAELYNLDAGPTDASADLKAEFSVRRSGSADLKAVFEVGQDSADLKAVFCVPVPGQEDFSTYTEVDSGGDITKTCTRVAWDTMRRDAISYVYKDFGASHFGDFEFEYTLNISDMVNDASATSRAMMEPVALTNHLTDMQSQGDGAGEATIAVFLRENGNTNDQFTFVLLQREDGGNPVVDEGAVVNGLGTYYITWGRNGTSVYANIYSDPERTSLVEALSGTGSTTYDYRYVEVCMSGGYSDGDEADNCTGYVENVEQIFPSASEDLAAEFTVRQVGTADLAATFYLPLNLFTKFTVRRTATGDLKAELARFEKVEDFTKYTEVDVN